MGAQNGSSTSASLKQNPRLLTKFQNWTVPVVAWMTTRIIGCIGLVVWPTSEGRWFHSFGLTYMDGGWYRIIVTIGYPNGALIDAGTTLSLIHI